MTQREKLRDNEPTHGDPDIYHHRWSNYCLYCHKEGYDPAANHGMRLWHYCVDCVLICKECSEPKPLFAFGYNFDSSVYQVWRDAYKAGGSIFRDWLKLFKPEGTTGHAPKEAHINLCNVCGGHQQDEKERVEREEATKRKQLLREKQEALLSSDNSQAALGAILKGIQS